MIWSPQRGEMLLIKVPVPAGDEPSIPSITSVYKNANWYEREVFDLFGIRFEGHPKLDRIMLPDSWQGHPLRRTEPIGAEPVDFTVTRGV